MVLFCLPDAAVLLRSSGQGQSYVVVCLRREGQDTDTPAFSASESFEVSVRCAGV